jgi:hypothetical protein
MDLQLVEQALAQQRLRETGTVHHDVLVAGGGLGLAHRRCDVGHVVNPAALRRRRDATRGYEDRHTVVITVPVAGVVERLAADDDRTSRHQLAEHLPTEPRRVEVRRIGGRLAEPLVQPDASGSEPVPRAVARAGDEPVERHRHVQDGLRHAVSSLSATAPVPAGRTRAADLGRARRAARRTGSPTGASSSGSLRLGART